MGPERAVWGGGDLADPAGALIRAQAAVAAGVPSDAMNAEMSELQARFERLELLYQVSLVIHSTLEPEEALELIVREAVRLTRAASGSVVLVNPTTGFLEIQAAQGLPPQARQLRLRLGEGITGWVARTGRVARVGNVREDPRYIMLRPNVVSELAVPFEVRGEVRGVINVDADRENAFTVGDQELLMGLAVQASTVVHNTWLYEQLRLKARLFESLVSVGQSVSSALNLDDTLQVITREACSMMNARMSSLRLLEETGAWLDLRASYGAGAAYRAKPRVPVEESLLGTVVRRRKALQVENVQTSTRYQSVEMARQEGLISLLSVPLLYRGQPTGTLNVYTAEPHHFANEEIRILGALAELSAIAIEKARLYERLVAVEDQLRQSERLSALGLLAAEVAHEIRNPLAVMKLLFHSLDLQFPATDPRARDAQIMGEKMDQLNRIVERILDVARSPDPTLAPVRVNPVLEDLGLLLRVRLRERGVRLELDLAPDLPWIEADATQLSQAFLNLTLNAIEAMPEGGVLRVRTRAHRLTRRHAAPDHLAITFQDTGCGMTAEQRERAFSSLLSTRKPGGTGLGLAIVSRIVEAHHGKVRITSAPGRGTTLRLILPVGRVLSQSAMQCALSAPGVERLNAPT